jgi:hypothetical protein
MQPHQERVVVELAELKEKREKLGAFLFGPILTTLAKDEIERLRRQHDIMVQYEGVLQERIAHFPL